MRSHSVWFALCLLPIDPVFNEFFCDEPTIDSIAHEMSQNMFFITSGGYYWWINQSDFPPKESDAKKLPEPFVKGTAAVYVDTLRSCMNARSKIQPFESRIFVTEWINDEHLLVDFDTFYLDWGEPSRLDRDNCLSPTSIDLSSDKIIDAMFVRNKLDIFLVQGNSYAMVNCSYMCTDPLDFGQAKPKYDISDWKTDGPIHAMYAYSPDVDKEEQLMVFQTKTYFTLKIGETKNGRVVAYEKEQIKDILTDFLKFNDTKCLSATETTGRDYTVSRTSRSAAGEDVSDQTMYTKESTESNPNISSMLATNQQENTTPYDSASDNSEPSNSEAESADKDDEVDTPAIVLLVGLFLLIIILSVVGLFLLMTVLTKRPKEASDSSLISTDKSDDNNELRSNGSQSLVGHSSSQVVSPRSGFGQTPAKSTINNI